MLTTGRAHIPPSHPSHPLQPDDAYLATYLCVKCYCLIPVWETMALTCCAYNVCIYIFTWLTRRTRLARTTAAVARALFHQVWSNGNPRSFLVNPRVTAGWAGRCRCRDLRTSF